MTRLFGADRYGTAANIATATFTTADTVVIATGENFPDALAGNYAAGQNNAPILLTRKSSVPAETQAAISALKATKAIILGGTDAIAAGGVPSGVTATRLQGATRYETAAAVANAGTTIGQVGGKLTAILATGDKFADALSGGPGAFAGDFPLLLTPGAPATALHSATKGVLTSKAIKHVVILGGTAAVSQAVEDEVKAMGITTERAQGADRTETARQFANWLRANLGFSAAHMNVARGDAFPDALAGGPHAGTEKAPILLTWSSTEATPGGSTTTGVLKYASDNAATLTSGHLYGGTAAVSAAVEAAIEAAGKGTTTAAPSVTSSPELQSATVVSTGAASGTFVRYCFDEVVGLTDTTGFNVYTGASDTPTASTTAVVNASDPKCVDASYAGITTAAGAAALTLATVEEDAVFGSGGAAGDSNPEGDAALGAGTTTTFSPGTTTGPDLVGVGTFNTPGVPANTTFVTFTFDEAAFDQGGGAGAYDLITIGNTEVPCTYDSGTGTTSIVVACANGGIPLTSAAIARGTVDAGAVADAAAAGNDNPLQAADVSSTSSGSDLVSATLDLTATTAGGATKVDRITYTFDEAIDPATVDMTDFSAYDHLAADIGTPTAFTVSANGLAVAVDFGDEELTNAVGATVADGAVTALDDADANEQDEVGLTNTGSATTTAGRTVGPDLTGVTLTAVKDAFNTVTGVTATYVFDEDLDTTFDVTEANVKLWLADGTEIVCSVAAVGTTEETDNTATCTTFVGPPTVSALSSAVLGTVAYNAVQSDDANDSNPEGASAVTKSGFPA